MIDLIGYNQYLSFYPDNILFTFLEEVDFLKITLKLLDKADYDLIKASKILIKLEEKLLYYPKIIFTKQRGSFRYSEYLADAIRKYYA